MQGAEEHTPLEQQEVAILEQHRKRKRPLWVRLVRGVLRTLLGFVILFTILRLLIAIPAVQSTLVRGTAKYLSNQLNTRVEVSSFDLRLWDRLELEHVYIEDEYQDTLLYTKTLIADFKTLSFFRQKIEIEELYLANTKFKLLEPTKDGKKNNIQFIVDYFNKDKKTKKGGKTPWAFNATVLKLEHTEFTFNKQRKGDNLFVKLPYASIRINDIDLNNKRVDMRSVVLGRPQAIFEINPPDTTVVRYVPPKSTNETAGIDTLTWSLSLRKFNLENGKMKIDNYLRTSRADSSEIDYDHLRFRDLNIALSDIEIGDGEMNSVLDGLRLKEGKGAVLENFTAKHARVTRRSMEFNDMQIITPDSYLGDTLKFVYPSIQQWNDFVYTVRMDVKLKDSEIAVKDILTFAPVLKKNKFFVLNKDNKVKIDGRIYDKVNQLKGRDINLSVGKSRLKGNFGFFDLMEGPDAVLNLNLNQLNTTVKDIALLLPEVNIPSEYYRLGNLKFNGNFDGFLVDFVAEGKLYTDLGFIQTGIRMDLKNRRKVTYSGNFGLKDFDLGRWLEDENFGKITINYDSTVVNGYGFELNEITANLKSSIDTFTYKNYTYNNILVNGKIDKQFFTGDLAIKDDNIDLVFDGTIDFNDSLPRFDLTTNFKKVDLRPLNLIKRDYQLQGVIRLDLVGDNPNNIVGDASVFGFKLVDDTITYEVDTLYLSSGFNNLATRRDFTVNSDILDANLSSNFDILKVSEILLKFFKTNYPAFSDKLTKGYKIQGDTSFVYKPLIDSAGYNEYFRFKVNIKKTKNLTNLLDPKFKEIKALNVSGRFDSKLNKVEFALDLPEINYANINIKGIDIKLSAIETNCTVFTTAENTIINDSLEIPGVRFLNTVKQDTLTFDIDGGGIGDIFQSLKMRGKLFTYEKGFQAELLSSNIFIHNRKWLLSGDNYVRFTQNSVETKNILLKNGDEVIALNSIGTRGMSLQTENLTLSWLKEFIPIENVTYDGKVFADVRVEDIFKLKNITSQNRIDSVYFKDRYWGTLNVKANLKNRKSPLKLEAKLNNDRKERVYLAGSYNLPSAKNSFRPANHLNFKAETRNFPLDVIEYFLGNNISDTRGVVDADVIFTGTPQKPKLTGNARIRDATIKVDYLQTRYMIDEAVINVTENGFLLGGFKRKDIDGNLVTGTILRDEQGNQALAQGAIYHVGLRNFMFNLVINSDKFLVLNTEEEDNSLFYGQAIAAVTLRVTGELSSPDLYIEGTSLRNTRIYLPLSYQRSASEVNFIQFVNKEDTLKSRVERSLNVPIGVSIEMDLNINPLAEIFMIFNEQSGDIIRGNGTGNLKIILTRTGEFQMFGEYEIEKGDYLFTYQSFFINKPFEVRKGGTIQWDGDPYEATIDLVAYYKNLDVPPYNLILEYIPDDATSTLARRSTKVELSMELKGDLFKPDISFDIRFPNIDQQLRAFVENKMTIVRADKNELNRQVFGLIILGSFLPSDESFASSYLSGSVVSNTLSEMLSNQLSIYLTNLLSEVVIGDVEFISSFEIDVNYRNYQLAESANSPSSANFGTGNEFQLGSRTGLLNDRVIVNIGGNIGSTAVGSTGTYVRGDFEIEWLISEDGRIRLRAYNRSEPNILASGTRLKFGTGISYRQEFNTFSEFLEGLKRSVKSKKE